MLYIIYPIKVKYLLFLVALFCCVGATQAQSVGRMKNTMGAESEQKAFSISPAGDLFYGINANSVSLLNSDASYSEVKHPEGTTNRAATLVKINADGTWGWGKQAYGAANKNSQITGVTYARNGYLYVTGGVATNSSVEGPANVFGTSVSSLGYMDYFVTKVNPATGEPVWATTMGSAADWDLPNAIVADADGNSYMLHVDFLNPFTIKKEDGLTELMTVTGAGNANDNLVVKLSDNGFPVWGRTIGSIYKEKSGAIALANDGHVLLATVLNSNNASSADKDLTEESLENRTLLVGDKSYEIGAEKATDVLLTKLSKTDGSVIWSYFWGGAGNQLVVKIAALDDNGCVVLGTDKGENKLLCFSASGEKRWEKTVAAGAALKGLSTDDQGGIYVSANYTNPISLDQIVLSSTGKQDAFIAKWNKDGELLYVDHTIGEASEAINHIEVQGAYLGLAGVITGDFCLPFTGNTDLVPRTVNESNHDFICAAYQMTPGFVGTSHLKGKKLVSLSYQVGIAFIPNPSFTIAGGALPAGLSLDAETGIIFGKPEVDGAGSFTVKVISTSSPSLVFEKEHSYIIERKPCDVLSVSPASLSGQYKTGAFVPQTLVLENADGVIAWTAESLPQGLCLHAETGVLSGVLERSGNFSFVVTGTDESGCSASRSYSIEVESFNYLLAPHLSWITGVQGRSFDHSKGNAIDKDGNVLVSSTYSALAFDERISFPDTGTPEAMVAKLNGLTGEALWAKRIGGEGSGNEQGQSVNSDPLTGDLVWTGIVTPNALIGDMTESMTLPNNGGRDAFLVRYSSSGVLRWVKTIGSSADWEAGIHTIFDRKGNIYLVGYKNNKPIDLEGAGGKTVTIEGTLSAMILIKFNGEGEALWGKAIASSTEIYGLVTDAQNNIYTSGIISGSVDFGNGKVVEATGKASFVAKFSEAGNCEWVKAVGSNGNVLPGRGNSLAMDSKENLYLATYAKGSTTYGTHTVTAMGGTDAVLFKMSSSGEPLSYIQTGSSTDDGAITVKTDHADNVYFTGYYAGMLDFGEGRYLMKAGGTTISTFVAKYSAEGEYIWSMPVGNNVSTGIMMTALGLSIEPGTQDVIISGNSNNNKVYAYAYSGDKDYADGAYFIARYAQSMGVYAVLPDAGLGLAYKGNIRATGCRFPENVHYSITQGALPEGLVLNNSTGEISGTALSGGKRVFTVSASDGSEQVARQVEINVTGASDCELSIDPVVSVPPCENGKPFSLSVYASLGTGYTSWQFEDATKVPHGLSIQSKDEETCVLSGIPNALAGKYTFTLMASDEAGCFASTVLTLDVTGIHSGMDKLNDTPQAVAVYPSLLTGNELFIHVSEAGTELYTLSIVDVKGVEYGQKQVEVEGAGKYPVAIDFLSDGVYFLSIYSKEKFVGTAKFIVKR